MQTTHKGKKYLAIHAHFYQPPRENPWTGAIPRQDSACPYSDWNERIARECYIPNAYARINDSMGRVVELVNNYEYLNFNFGPTLLTWLEKRYPVYYAKITAAAAATRAACGHSNAIAQAYNHTILPLAPLDDRLTQILWGLLTVLGVGIALMPSEHLHRSRRELVVGSLFAGLASLCGAGGGVVSRRAYEVAQVAGQHLDGGNAAFQRVLGGLLLAGPCLLFVKRRAFKVQAHAPRELVVEASRRKWRGVWPWVLVNGFAGQTLGVSCMQWALATTPAGIVFAILAITPIVIIPFAIVLEHERPTLHSLVGGAIAVGGVIALALSR